MSTGAIIAIVVVVVLLLALLLFLMPRMRARRAQRQLVSERHDAADAHRDEAERRAARARLAEREAKRERAEAELHETRAELHDQGLADEELGRDPSAGRPADATAREDESRKRRPPSTRTMRGDGSRDVDAPAGGDRRRV